MAIIYTYPSGTPSASDNILGTQVDPITEENKTVQFGIQDVANLATNNYLETTVTVTSAQLLALNGADVTLIAAQGANTYIKILLVTSFLDYESIRYTATQPLNVSTGGNTAASIPTAQYDTAADRVYSPAISSIALAENSAVFLTTDASPTNGNSPLKLKIRYQVLNTTAF